MNWAESTANDRESVPVQFILSAEHIRGPACRPSQGLRKETRFPWSVPNLGPSRNDAVYTIAPPRRTLLICKVLGMIFALRRWH